MSRSPIRDARSASTLRIRPLERSVRMVLALLVSTRESSRRAPMLCNCPNADIDSSATSLESLAVRNTKGSL